MDTLECICSFWHKKVYYFTITIEKTFKYINERGVKPFDYNINIEINNELTPTTWTKKEI